MSHGCISAVPRIAFSPFLDTWVNFLLNLYLGLLCSLLGSDLLLLCPLLNLLLALLGSMGNLVLLHSERSQALLGFRFGVNVTFLTGLADNLLESYHLRLNTAIGLAQAFAVSGHVLLLELRSAGLYALGVLQGCLLAALSLAQARGQLVNAFLNAFAVLVKFSTLIGLL
jgi:hypothetical protein